MRAGFFFSNLRGVQYRVCHCGGGAEVKMVGFTLPVALLLAACAEVEPQPKFLPDGSPNCNWTPYSPFSGEILQAANRAYRQACLAGKAEQEARARGGTVTTCYPTGDGGTVCVSD